MPGFAAIAMRLAPEPNLAPDLLPLDRKVIALARGDSLASISAARGWRYRLECLLGMRRTNRLADPRLEALRSYAVRCWHGQPGASSRHAHTVAAYGYSPAAVLREMGLSLPKDGR